MAAIVPSKLIAMSQAKDPRKAIWAGIGDAIRQIDVFGPQVLVGTFIESERTAGGILKPQKTTEESLWQGITGLVLKKGPRAFVDEPENGVYWHGHDIAVDTWVIFRFSSAWEFHLNGVSVRLVDDRDIRGAIGNPELLMARPSVSMG